MTAYSHYLTSPSSPRLSPPLSFTSTTKDHRPTRSLLEHLSLMTSALCFGDHHNPKLLAGHDTPTVLISEIPRRTIR